MDFRHRHGYGFFPSSVSVLMARRYRVAIVFFFLIVCHTPSALGFKCPIEPIASDDKYAYQQIDSNQCEGFTVRDVANASALRVLGFYSKDAKNALQDNDIIALYPQSSANQMQINGLHANGAESYRVDATLAENSFWQWDTKRIVKAPENNIDIEGIHFYAYSDEASGTGSERVFFPLSKMQAGSDFYIFVIQSQRAINSVAYRKKILETKYISKWEPLGTWQGWEVKQFRVDKDFDVIFEFRIITGEDDVDIQEFHTKTY